LLTPPRVRFATDDDLAVGEFGIATRVAQPEDAVPSLPAPTTPPPARSVSIPVVPPPVPVAVPAPVPVPVPDAAPPATMVYRPRVQAADVSESTSPPEPKRELVTLTLEGRAHPITSRSVVIGRSRECDLRVADGNASRRHAEVMQEGATYLVVDLGSTNGTELNGKRITREKLTDGDRITIGATDLVFGRALP